MGTPLYNTDIIPMTSRPTLTVMDDGDYFVILDTSTGKISKILKTNIMTALKITYDNTSGLTAETVQAALDELVTNLGSTNTVIESLKGVGWTDENLVDHEERLDTLEGTGEGSVAKAIDDALEQIETDKTLAVSDAAADAKVTGDKVGELKSAISSEDDIVALNGTVIEYQGGENLYNNNDPTMLLEHYKIDNGGNIIPDAANNRNVLLVPVYDIASLYTCMTTNSAGTEWINQSITPQCYSLLMEPLGTATPETNGVKITNKATRFLGFDISNTYLSRQPMIIRNWDGANKSSYVPYTLPVPFVMAQKISNLDDYSYKSAFSKTANLLNLIGVEYQRVINGSGETEENVNYNTSGYIAVEGSAKYITNYCQHLAWYDADKNFISRTNQTLSWTAPSNAAYARVDINTLAHSFGEIIFVKGETLPEAYVSPLRPIYPISSAVIYGKSQWAGKIWGAYGDSITAISNGNGLDLGWAKLVNKHHEFAGFFGRGIGSQKFSWGTNGGSVTFVDATDGKYNSRNDSYNKDNYSGDVPEGCVVIRGAFCSWDRITHMFPSSIKDTINMVYIMGGTNDINDDTDLEWVPDNTTDPEWAASPYYNTYSGDYNIAHLSGGVASTIMKMQAWMPQAIIIIGTPLNGQTNQTGAILPANIPDEYQKSKIIVDIANMFGTPIVNVFSACGINCLNSPTYITDGTHPYNDAGKMMLSRAVIGGLRTIYPRLA